MNTKLSVNINKIATLRNSRGGNNPDLVKMALDAERSGADGITVHPRPDERHIRYQDVYDLKKAIKTELNIEGNPQEPRFVELVLNTRPAQVTLVPDAAGQLTSNHGWDTFEHKAYLKEIISEFQLAGVRVSIFIDPDQRMIEGAAETGTNRIELYTEAYAAWYHADPNVAVSPYVQAAEAAQAMHLGVNAGHDLDLANLKFFAEKVPGLLEVSIGHALVCDALTYGWGETVEMYKRLL